MKHGFIKSWDEFWDVYISNVKGEIGDDFERLRTNLPQGADTISKSLKWMTTDEMRKTNDLIRKITQIPKKITLIYDPGATTFYSKYDIKSKKYQIAYPTCTKYMIYWEPAMKFAFRHELGHIIRGDCTLNMGNYHNVWSNNLCMDIRINGVLDREGHIQTLCCLLYNLDNPNTGESWGATMNVPEVAFPKIDLDWDEEVRYIPPWTTIADAYERAEQENQQQQPQLGESSEGQGEGQPGEGQGEGGESASANDILDKLNNAGVNGEDANTPKFGEDDEVDENAKGEPDGPSSDGSGGPKSDVEEKIENADLNHKINRSIDNLEKVKSKHEEEITKEELNAINKAIEELNELKQ